MLSDEVELCCRSRPYRRGVGQDGGPGAVFVFHEGAGDVNAYGSLKELRGDLEAVDVRGGEYAFFAADGRVIEAVVTERAAQDFDLCLSTEDASQVSAGALDDSPPEGGDRRVAGVVAAGGRAALLDARWDTRWPRRPAWLNRRLHGAGPVVGDGG